MELNPVITEHLLRTQIFPAGRVTFQSVSLPSGSSVTSLRTGLFVDMKHRLQKDKRESGASVWERNATRIPPTHKTRPAGHISAALTAATDCKTCTLWGHETKMHGCKYTCRYRKTHFCKYSTHSLTQTHKGLLCWTGQALLTCFSSLHWHPVQTDLLWS